LVDSAGGIAAFAVCHYGPRSEAGADTCFVKFGAVRDGPSAERDYLRLLDACEALAAAVVTSNVFAGANMARHEAYRHLVARGFRTEIQGVTMHRQNDPGYCRPGAYIIGRFAVSHQCIRPLIGACAPGHHGCHELQAG